MSKLLLLSSFFCLSFITMLHAQQNRPDTARRVGPEKKRSAEAEENENEESNEEHAKQKWFKMMRKPNANYVKVKRKYDRYFKRHPLEGSATKEFGTAWLLSNVYYLDKHNRVQRPPAINYNTIRPLTVSPPASVTDTMAGDWRMLGPRNSVQVGAGVGNNGGYAYCVRIDPTNINKYFVSFVTGGLWVSSDGGNSWQLTDGNLPDLHYYDIDVCKANSSYVYAVSDSAVIKSTNGGLTWMPTTLNATNYPGGSGYDIAVSPANPNLVLARWGTAIYRSADGGTTWTAVASGLKAFSVWDSDLNSEVLDWHASDASVVYFTDRSDNDVTVDVFRSGDLGQTFSKISSLTPAITTDNITGWSKILTATNSPSAIYIAIGTGTNAYSHHAVHLYKLDAATGAVLLTRTNMVDGIDQSYGSPTMLHHGDLTMDISDDQHIVWGSYSQSNAQYSTDNGATFHTSTTTVHADLRGVSMMNGKVLLGTDGSAVVSTDGGDNFTIVTNSISNHELWGFGSAFKSDILGAGCNHGPLMIRDYEAPGGWYSALGADQGNTDVNPLDSVTLFSQGYDSYHVTRTGIKTFTNGAQQVDPGGIYAYFNSMEFHPHQFNTLITHHAGQYPTNVAQATKDIWKKSLIRSDDNGVTIDSVIHTFSDQVFREKICMTNPNTMYVVVGLTGNNLWKTTDAGATWTSITPSTAVTGSSVRNISDIAVSDSNPGEIWVTYSGVQNTCQVLHSTDGGATYTNLTTPVLGSFPVTKIIFQRGTDGGVYIGSKSGIFYRNHSMTDWAPLGNGLPRMDIRYLFINYYKGNQGKLLVGTSRGAWDHDLYEHSRTMAQISASTASPSCQMPLVQFRDYSVVSSGGSGASYSWSFPGGTPSTSTLENPIVSYAGAANGSHDVTLTVTDQYGTHTQTLTAFINYDSTTCCQGAPAGWTFTDIGPATTPGVLCYTAPTKNFKITSNGSGLSDPNDTVSFVYTSLNGDGVITARVKDVTSTYNTNAGIMIRNSLAPNSGYVFLSSLDTRGVFDQWRSSDGAYTNYNAVTSLPMPMWVRLQRKGNNINSFYSGDGITWTAYNSYTVTLGTAVYVGLACSGKGTVTNIDSVNIGPIPPCTGGSANGCPSLDTVPGRAISFYDYTYFHLPFAAPPTNTFTITGWIKPNGLQPSQAGIVAWDNGYFFLSQHNDNQLGYDWNGNPAMDAWQSGLFAPTDKWSFVAMVVHPDSASFYLNDKQATHIIPQDASAITSPVLGNSNQGAGYYTGLMDELTVWNRALSTDEIDSLRHLTKENIVDKSLPGYDPSLIGYFQFNDSNSTSGYNIIDSSSFIFSTGAKKAVSTAPVGAGNSGKATIGAAGAYPFGNTGVTLTFPALGVYPDGNVWVTRIGQQPDVVPKASASSNAYWIIDNYGADSAFSSLSSLEIDKAIDIQPADAAIPGNFGLLRREDGTEGNTWGSPLNNATAATAGTPGNLHFTPANITSSGQLIISRGYIPPPAVDTVPGKALVLNGYPDKILMNDMVVNNTNTFTITGWIKPAGTQNPYSVLVSNASTATIFMVRDNNELGYQWNDNGWSWGSGLIVPPDQWSFVAMVIRPGSATVYLNNQQASQTGLSNPLLSLNGFCIGEDNRGYTNRSFVGQLDELTFWNRALNDDEIRGLRHLTKDKQVNYTLPAYDANLVGYFQFNDAANTAAVNIVTGNSYAFTGAASKVTSTAPVGAGVSAKANASAAGLYSFGNTGVSIGFPAGTNPGGDCWVTRLNQDPNGLPNNFTGSGKYWIVNNYGPNTTFTVLDSIQFNGAMKVLPADIANPAAFRLFKRPDNAEGNSWGAEQAFGTALTAGDPGSLTFAAGNNISSFSQFYITNSTIPLPVTLLSFTAVKDGPGGVLVQWKVSEETDFSHYELERSADDIAFSLISTANAVRDGGKGHTYSFHDGSPVNGVGYYRLKMIDIDGKSTYSKVVAINFSNTGFIKMMPNPVRDKQPLVILNTGNSPAMITFYSADGKLIASYNILPNDKRQVNSLPKGALMYKATNAAGKKASGVVLVE